MELTITELQNLLEHKEWKAIVEEYKDESEKAKNKVLLAYLEWEEDEPKYNYKHTAVEQLKIAIEIRDRVSTIDLPAVQEFTKFINEKISDYETTIKEKLVADGHVYFTATDIEIRKAVTKVAFTKWIDEQIEGLKKAKDESNVMEKIREE